MGRTIGLETRKQSCELFSDDRREFVNLGANDSAAKQVLQTECPKRLSIALNAILWSKTEPWFEPDTKKAL